MPKRIAEMIGRWSYTEFGKSFFKANKDVINRKNMEIMQKISVLVSCAYIFFILMGVFFITARERMTLYASFSIIFGLFYGITVIYDRNNRVMESVYTYIFTGILLSFGICLGCLYDKDIPAMLFLVLIVCLPMLFIVPPIYMAILIILYMLIFLQVSYCLKTTEIFELDLLNAAGCFFVGLISMYTAISSRSKEISLNAKLKEECNDDELTGMRNRRDFNEYIRDLVKNNQDSNMAIIFVDIDDFKEYNDMYGKIYGDKCIVQVAEVIEEFAKRHKCYAARYLGEEFVIVDRTHNCKDLEAICAELVELVEMLNIENINSKYQKITVSAGIASREITRVNTVRDLINLADDALYQVKLNGKNGYMTARHNIFNNDRNLSSRQM